MQANYKKTKEWILANAVTETAEKFQVDITGTDDQWRKLAFSLSNTFEEEGRDFFYRLSKLRKDFEYAEDTTSVIYNDVLKSKRRISFASFLFYADRAGIKRETYLITYGEYYICLPI